MGMGGGGVSEERGWDGGTDINEKTTVKFAWWFPNSVSRHDALSFCVDTKLFDLSYYEEGTSVLVH